MPVHTAIVLFTRDLRIEDNPVLAAAAANAEYVLPLFVQDVRLHATGFAAQRRSEFLASALGDLDERLRGRGAALLIRHGEVVTEVCRLAEQTGAAEVHLAADVSAFAARRERALAAALERQRRKLVRHEAVHNVIAPGTVTPQGSDHFAVFTPYYRRWADAPWRGQAAAPRGLRLPPGIELSPQAGKGRSVRWPGGETPARGRAERWLRQGIDEYQGRHDDLAADATSRLSPDLHFGCLSARELAEEAAARDTAGAAAFLRQLAWRDFHHQVLAARPAAAHRDYRPRGDAWRDDRQALDAWREGQTGIPIVDAGMRQLSREGWMHNRARLIVASFLTKTLYLDWRHGAAHFTEHLLDADIANNQLNWQWVAGTGTDTRPNRVLNPLRQAERYDPGADYTRRWVPELAGLKDPGDVHRPWRLGGPALRKLGYPPPVTDLETARLRFLEQRKPSRNR
ncbi:cryptochrome/photolyase family protein [Sciscionella sediminilitoris]|uniref:cryptochrome/photolyase family protein n=1 Tax=Sciscionella sediminilitoris TaxID=1445613 RepID=UPI0004DF2085|nr:deoxyribodipyrimidine photo-lyase [Sciscionella sp. SE31]